jgi:hypothetical protein
MERFRCNGAYTGHLVGMSLVDTYRNNANDCAFLAEQAGDDDVKLAFIRMERAWRALAQEQQRLNRMMKKRPG